MIPRLTPYGRREWMTITMVVALAAVACGLLLPWWSLVILAALWLAAVSFFRDPRRAVPDDLPEGAMLSPADGRVSAVLTVDHHEAAGGPATIIRIFLSVLNVHVNRAPCDGEVVAKTYRPGKFLNAQTEESARVNESSLITMRIAGGETIGVRQVSGMIARRIVCTLEIGDRVRRGERFGMIKFGSTAELVLPRPEDVQVKVVRGERVTGGLTTLAVLTPIVGSPPTVATVAHEASGAEVSR